MYCLIRIRSASTIKSSMYKLSHSVVPIQPSFRSRVCGSPSPSLCAELENRKTAHSHRLEEQFRGEGSFKKAFQLGHPLLYFAHFGLSTSLGPSVPFHPLNSSCLSSLPRALYLLCFPPGDVQQTIQLKRKKDRWLLTASSSLNLYRANIQCGAQGASGCYCVCKWGWGLRVFDCVDFLKGFSWNRCTCAASLNYWKNDWTTETYCGGEEQRRKKNVSGWPANRVGAFRSGVCTMKIIKKIF